jgi:uncharacterized protein (DUF302 family)
MKILQDWHGIIMKVLQNNLLEAPVIISSMYNVKETIDLLVILLGRLHMTIYARINRQAESRCCELETRPMECILYDNPELSSPLVQKHPTLALYFPMRIVAWEDEGCHVAFNDPMLLLQVYDAALHGSVWRDLRMSIEQELAK